MVGDQLPRTDPIGPFGTPDGSRADIETMLASFVPMDSHPGFGAVATRADDASVRVIVGRMGAGKTVYMRRLSSCQDGARPAVYTDRPQQTLPQTDLIVRVCQWFPRRYLTEKWMYLWGRAILRSLATHLVMAREFRSAISDVESADLRRDYGHLIGEFRRPRSIYSELREIINDHNSGKHLSRYLEHPDWDDLEHTLADIVRSSPPIFFYLDAVDDTFNAAPLYWLRCQEGLFLQVMQMLRDARFGSRLHVVVCLRDLVLSSIYQSEHAPRYHDEPHIRVLNWSREAIQYLLQEKLGRLPDAYKMSPGATDPIEAWLGSTWIPDPARGVDEELLHYLLRHTRLIPRDLVSLGNALSRTVLQQKEAGRTDVPPEVLRAVVGASAKRFGDSQLAQCASQIAADSIPGQAMDHGYGEYYLSSQEYAESLGDQLKNIVGSVGVDRFSRSALEAVDELSAEHFDGCTRVSSVLWQNGLLGYLDGGDARFYSAVDSSDFDIVKNADEYVLHPCVLPSVRGIRPVGPRPVHPYAKGSS